MRGRDLFEASDHLIPDVGALLRQERSSPAWRRRCKERGRDLRRAHKEIEAAFALGDAGHLLTALTGAVPGSGQCRSLLAEDAVAEVLSWTRRLWVAEEPYGILDELWRSGALAAAGLWFPFAVLQVKDPYRFFPWDESLRQGLASLEDGAARVEPSTERYQLFNEGVARLCESRRLHALEVPAVLADLAADASETQAAPPGFRGFCTDTFRFLAELAQHNSRRWMEEQRERYLFAVRDPLVELCRALAERYIEPVLGRQRGWDLETAARGGRALTSICKNDYGRSVPYQTELWITFYRRGAAGRGGEMQLFVRLDATGLSYGVCLGRQARDVAQQLADNVREHADRLFHTLAENDALADCRFGHTAELAGDSFGIQPAGPDDLRTWVDGQRAGEPLVAARRLTAETPLLRCDDLVGDILLTFDRLLPLFACAALTDPRPLLAGAAEPTGTYSEDTFHRDTSLSARWLQRARALLGLKRQLILQGVPGTGKTHVARCLAALLTSGCEEAERLVQFHPAYSYEEFVEGIKVRSVEIGGRHEVTYPVEEGLLCAFAAEAANRPGQPHVLIIDEINRGNLPRVFGELLYLLEYREQTIRLPYSRRSFRLPANLYLLATMNAADRSVALIDQALRRRFSFLEMPPDASILAAWLRAHPPADGPAFADTVVTVFERLNARLRADLGAAAQVGHSYFMVPRLDEIGLHVVWEHQLMPLLEEHFAGQPGRAASYTLESFLGRTERATPRSERRKRREAGARVIVNPP
jgi:MoxR-like ATPase